MNQRDSQKDYPKSFDGLSVEEFDHILSEVFARYGLSFTKEEDQEAEPSTTPPLRAWLSPIPQRKKS